MANSPNLAFGLLLSGVLLLYCEAVWIGKIYFGLAGSILLLVGAAGFWNLPHNTFGVALIGASLLAFLVEAIFATYFLAGIAATTLLAAGFWKLCPAPTAIAPELAFPFSILLGALTVRLLTIAKQARRNKQSDL